MTINVICLVLKCLVLVEVFLNEDKLYLIIII